MNFKKLATATCVAAIAMAGAASAHVWNIGWKSQGGGLTFYGVSYHTGGAGGTGGVDDFAANPAGFVINGTNVTFDIGSATNLNDCNGPGGLVSGACDSDWDALAVDGALAATGYTSDYYGKYAFATLTSAELAGLGIGTGNNSVLLGTFSNNVHWANLSFSSATVPINIVVTPPSSVPLPAGMSLMLAGVAGFAGLRRMKKRAA